MPPRATKRPRARASPAEARTGAVARPAEGPRWTRDRTDPAVPFVCAQAAGRRSGAGAGKGGGGGGTGGGTGSGTGGGGTGNGASASASASASSVLPWSCGDSAVLGLLAGRDPTGGGLEGSLALRLLQALLSWEPAGRPSPAQALRHAYFTTAGGTEGAGAPAGAPTVPSEGGEATAGCGRLPMGAAGWC